MTTATNTARTTNNVTAVFENLVGDRFSVVIKGWDGELVKANLTPWAHKCHSTDPDMPKLADGEVYRSMSVKHIKAFCTAFGFVVPDWAAQPPISAAKANAKAAAPVAQAQAPAAPVATPAAKPAKASKKAKATATAVAATPVTPIA